jgi:hypothetical protein
MLWQTDGDTNAYVVCACRVSVDEQDALDVALCMDRLHPYRADALCRVAMAACYLGRFRSSVHSLGKALLCRREVRQPSRGYTRIPFFVCIVILKYRDFLHRRTVMTQFPQSLPTTTWALR